MNNNYTLKAGVVRKVSRKRSGKAKSGRSVYPDPSTCTSVMPNGMVVPTYSVEGTVYHDFFKVDVPNLREFLKIPETKRKGPRGGVAEPFPDKLYWMLVDVEKEGLEHIVSWQPHGRSFRVREMKKFLELIMPRFFNQSKMSSFQRQLNLYGFERILAGEDKGSYFHELFLRGRPELCQLIFRTKVKSNAFTGQHKGLNSAVVKQPAIDPNLVATSLYSIPLPRISPSSAIRPALPASRPKATAPAPEKIASSLPNPLKAKPSAKPKPQPRAKPTANVKPTNAAPAPIRSAVDIKKSNPVSASASNLPSATTSDKINLSYCQPQAADKNATLVPESPKAGAKEISFPSSENMDSFMDDLHLLDGFTIGCFENNDSNTSISGNTADEIMDELLSVKPTCDATEPQLPLPSNVSQDNLHNDNIEQLTPCSTPLPEVHLEDPSEPQDVSFEILNSNEIEKAMENSKCADSSSPSQVSMISMIDSFPLLDDNFMMEAFESNDYGQMFLCDES